MLLVQPSLSVTQCCPYHYRIVVMYAMYLLSLTFHYGGILPSCTLVAKSGIRLRLKTCWIKPD
ncbi:hypothetical protein BDZ94DRAFT_1271597 [Collybia nuda]|uniref:Uncharacterized protein n=1 Tax=Collybia nuda TaxID=64659 RepID=A0A9P5XYN8_9AGAR|nr:hypothetical protein BDZ94DRAFT_1271597 [Collybia nuda]